MSDTLLGVINPVMALIIAVGAFLIWRRNPAQRYILGMAAASLSLGISFALNHYLVVDNAAVIRIVTTLFAFIAVISVAWAACVRLGQQPPLKAWIAGAMGTVALMTMADPANDVIPWIFLVNVYCGIVFAMAALLLAEANSPEPMDRATIWVFGIIALQFFVRPILAYMLGGAMGSDAYRASPGHAAYLVVGAISMVLLAGVLMGAAMVDVLKALKQDAQTDSLSGLATRDAFVEQATQMLARARAEDVAVALIVADIDHFKKVNDLWGHPAGDKAIARIGAVFSRTIRPSDLAGRIGGEEFCILVWNCAEEPAAKLAERLRVQFAREEHEDIDPGIRLTASFGVAAWAPGEGYHPAYERADAALYQAKRTGRNRVVSAALGQVGDAPRPEETGTGSGERTSAGDSASSASQNERPSEAEIVELAKRTASFRDVG
ncbi:MAG: GGDEF domain-containing protein [Pseudomonadota bacterium]